MDKKEVSTVSIIETPDGPTSVFLIGGKGSKRTLKQEIQKKLFALRKKRIAKLLKANPHTMEQVIEYAKSKWGYTDISKESEEYKTEYNQMRASFIIQYKPELLGKLKDYPELEGRDEESIKHFMMLINQRQKAAEDIPTELFDIDLHILQVNRKDFHSNMTGYSVMFINIMASLKMILTIRQRGLKICLEHWLEDKIWEKLLYGNTKFIGCSKKE